jgi:hypothetical protein
VLAEASAARADKALRRVKVEFIVLSPVVQATTARVLSSSISARA